MEQNPVVMFNMKVAHIGVNAADNSEAKSWADEFLKLMGLEIRETSASYFNGELVEIMKQNGRGTNGHIGFSVNDCQAALKFFEEKGMKVLEETKKFDADGVCYFAYFEGEIAGFAIHLVRQ